MQLEWKGGSCVGLCAIGLKDWGAGVETLPSAERLEELSRGLGAVVVAI